MTDQPAAAPAAPAPAADHRPAAAASDDVRPNRTLGLLVVAHAVNHAQGVILPLLFVAVIDEFGVTPATIAFLAAAGGAAAGGIQLTFGLATRLMPRRAILAIGGVLFGGGFAAQAFAHGFGAFSVLNIVSRMGGAPQHAIGNGLLAEQFPRERRGFAISAHISGGNVGTLVVALVGAWMLAALGWRTTVIVLGVPAVVLALAVLVLVRESGSDRAAAVAHGNVRAAYRRILRTPDLLWIFLTSVLGGGGRGLGVVNLFVLLYVGHVLRFDEGTTNLMYAALVVLSVPAPLVAGWLSDRFGRRPLIVSVYVGGAIGFLVFIAAGSNLLGLWLGIAIMGVFSFAESPQLQALMADLSPPEIRDVAFATYFTLAFGVGSLWTALYGAIIDVAGESAGLPIAFVLMSASFIAAALTMIPVREPPSRGPEAIESVEAIA
ncbi:MAG TPA: MFS transporter [Candidatus Limnocylindrales bacterium]|nr:MFS transporter [Candidatus Limnocylindrales bacterium]